MTAIITTTNLPFVEILEEKKIEVHVCDFPLKMSRTFVLL